MQHIYWMLCHEISQLPTFEREKKAFYKLIMIIKWMNINSTNYLLGKLAFLIKQSVYNPI